VENNPLNHAPSLLDVLRKINEGVDDFSSNPAKTASDRGAFDDYPLHKVAIWGDIPSAAVLLANGADINALGEDGDTPLHRAIAGRQIGMVRFLVSQGADIHIQNRYRSSPQDDASDSNDSDLTAALVP